MDATQRSYAAATARPPGHTSTPRTPATQLSPLVGMPSLRPRTALRQELDLANWTPLWNGGDAATGVLTGDDPPAPTVDDTATAAPTAADATSLNSSGSPPLLSPEPIIEVPPRPLTSEDIVLDSGASVCSAADVPWTTTPPTAYIDPMATLNAAISLHLAELDCQRIAIGEKYGAFHDLLVKTRTDFDVSAIEARVSSAVAAKIASITELLSTAEDTIQHRAYTSVDIAMTAAVAPRGIMGERINDGVKSAVLTAVDNIMDEVRPHVQETVDTYRG
jgi:hypothetical protein